MTEENKVEKEQKTADNSQQEESAKEPEKKTSEEAKPKEEAKEEEKKEEKAEKKEEEKEEVEVPEKFKHLVEEIEKMSVLDLAELVKILEKKFGVSAVPVSAPVAGGAPASQGGAEGEEKSVFTVQLKAVGDKKIEVIKLVRDLMGKGLKEAKDLVDAVANGPQVIKENVKKEEAEEIKKKFGIEVTSLSPTSTEEALSLSSPN